MQAAFVDMGLRRAGFLYVADVESLDGGESLEKFVEDEPAEEDDKLLLINGVQDDACWIPLSRTSCKKGRRSWCRCRRSPSAPRGPVLRHITLPGRYLVFMPMVDHIGVSRRIVNEEERQRLKDIVREGKQPGVGFIVRTVSEGVDRQELHSDMTFLTKLWEDIQRKAAAAPRPCTGAS